MGDKIVMYSQEWGVYLGSCLGLGFWSKLDPAGQDAACCFSSEEEARAHSATWDTPPPDNTKYITVTTVGVDWATIPECVRAGIESWHPDGDEHISKNN